MPLITIASVTIPNWQGNTSGVVLRIYANADFTAESGTFYPRSVRGNPASLGTFYQAYACTVNGSSLVIPQVQLDSTTDSPDNSNATYSAELWDSTTGKAIQHFGTFERFALGPTQTSTTWAAIFAAEADD
jgi:hypothetical protein